MSTTETDRRERPRRSQRPAEGQLESRFRPSSNGARSSCKSGWGAPHRPGPMVRPRSAREVQCHRWTRSSPRWVPSASPGRRYPHARGTRRSGRTGPIPIRRGSSSASSPAEYSWCQLFSEPGSGLDTAGDATRAEQGRAAMGDERPEGVDHLERTIRHWGPLPARTNWDKLKHKGLGYFLLDMSQPRRQGPAAASR